MQDSDNIPSEKRQHPFYFFLSDFSLEHWLTESGYTAGSSLGTEISRELFEILEVTRYLNSPVCSRKDTLYSPSIRGWKKGQHLVTFCVGLNNLNKKPLYSYLNTMACVAN